MPFWFTLGSAPAKSELSQPAINTRLVAEKPVSRGRRAPNSAQKKNTINTSLCETLIVFFRVVRQWLSPRSREAGLSRPVCESPRYIAWAGA